MGNAFFPALVNSSKKGGWVGLCVCVCVCVCMYVCMYVCNALLFVNQSRGLLIKLPSRVLSWWCQLPARFCVAVDMSIMSPFSFLVFLLVSPVGTMYRKTSASVYRQSSSSVSGGTIWYLQSRCWNRLLEHTFSLGAMPFRKGYPRFIILHVDSELNYLHHSSSYLF